jgi:hypothetical protein
MNVQQSADVMMFRNLSQFLSQNAPILDKSPTLKEDASDFQNALTQLEAKIQEVDTMSEITGQEKLELRSEIIQDLLRVMSILHRHAVKNKNASLQKNTDIQFSLLNRMTDAAFLAYCNQALEIIRPNAVILSTALIAHPEQTAILEKIQLFKTVKPQVKLNITQKAVQKEEIDHAVKAIKELLKTMLDASVLSVQATDSDFVRAYELNRQRRAPAKANPAKSPKN